MFDDFSLVNERIPFPPYMRTDEHDGGEKEERSDNVKRDCKSAGYVGTKSCKNKMKNINKNQRRMGFFLILQRDCKQVYCLTKFTKCLFDTSLNH